LFSEKSARSATSGIAALSSGAAFGLLIFTITLLSARQAAAYQYISAGCGNINFSDGHISFNVADNITADELTAYELGADRATLYSNSSITLNDVSDTDYGRGNGENELFRDSSHNTAYCSYSYYTNSCAIAEADMAIGDEPWVTEDIFNSYTFGVSGRSLTGTAIHEAGHCVGMAHENRYYNMMGADFSHLNWTGSLNVYYGPGEDLSNGLIDLHGKRSSSDIYRDVGVSTMRYSYASGQYSSHKKGVLTSSSSGNELPRVDSFNSLTVYQVETGSPFVMQLTLENNGEKDVETPLLGLYLSSNDVISTADQQLATYETSLTRNTPLETSYTVILPSGTTPGDYFPGSFY
jgi:hypothetical protein